MIPYTPLVSIYIPTYNRLQLLKRAIDSVLAQDETDFEIVVVDDGSTDGTKEYLKELTQREPRVKSLKKTGKKGAPASRNQAIAEAKGKYITGLDDDDYFHPKRLSTMLAHYDPAYSCVGSNWITLTRRGQFISSRVKRVLDESDLFNRNMLGTQILTERSRVIAVGGFDETLEASQDLDLWIRLIAKFGPALRIKPALYFMDTSHDAERISSSPKRRKGTLQLVAKYSDQMSEKQKRYKLEMTIEERQSSAIARVLTYRRYGWQIFLEVLRSQFKIG